MLTHLPSYEPFYPPEEEDNPLGPFPQPPYEGPENPQEALNEFFRQEGIHMSANAFYRVQTIPGSAHANRAERWDYSTGGDLKLAAYVEKTDSRHWHTTGFAACDDFLQSQRGRQ